MDLVNKSYGYVWWSSPVNAMGDANATNTLRQELKSSITMTYGQPASRTTKNLRSAKNGKFKYQTIDNGIKVTYSFSKADITVPVEYTLVDDYLKVSVKTSEIEEKNDSDTDGNILTALTPSVMANTAPTVAPLETPMMPGSAKGLLNNPCNMVPEAAKPAPTINPTRVLGERININTASC